MTRRTMGEVTDLSYSPTIFPTDDLDEDTYRPPKTFKDRIEVSGNEITIIKLGYANGREVSGPTNPAKEDLHNFLVDNRVEQRGNQCSIQYIDNHGLQSLYGSLIGSLDRNGQVSEAFIAVKRLALGGDTVMRVVRVRDNNRTDATMWTYKGEREWDPRVFHFPGITARDLVNLVSDLYNTSRSLHKKFPPERTNPFLVLAKELGLYSF